MKRKAGSMACTIHPWPAMELAGKVAAERTTSAVVVVEAAPRPIGVRGETVETASPPTAPTFPLRQIRESWVQEEGEEEERGRTTATAADLAAVEVMERLSSSTKQGPSPTDGSGGSPSHPPVHSSSATVCALRAQRTCKENRMNEVDVLWGMYQEHCVHGRHHEEQRSTVTNIIISVAAAVVTLLSIAGLVAATWPLAALLLILGLFGALFSLKQYERFRFHMKCAAVHKDALEVLVPKARLKELRKKGEEAHGKNYALVQHVHLFIFWIVLNLGIATLGPCLASNLAPIGVLRWWPILISLGTVGP